MMPALDLGTETDELIHDSFVVVDGGCVTESALKKGGKSGAAQQRFKLGAFTQSHPILNAWFTVPSDAPLKPSVKASTPLGTPKTRHRTPRTAWLEGYSYQSQSQSQHPQHPASSPAGNSPGRANNDVG